MRVAVKEAAAAAERSVEAADRRRAWDKMTVAAAARTHREAVRQETLGRRARSQRSLTAVDERDA